MKNTKPKFILCLALVLSGSLVGCATKKDKHSTSDADLEKNLRREILKIDESIKKTTPNYWDSPDSYWLEHGEGRYSPIWYGHGSRSGYSSAGYDPARGDDVLCLSWILMDKDSKFGKSENPSKSNYADSASGKKFPMQEIFHENVKDTGISIKVEIVTTNITLINVLRDKLNK